MLNSMETKVKDETVEGQTIEVYLTDSGEFLAECGDDTYRADTLKSLLDKLRSHVRAERAKIPVSWLTETWRRGREADEIVDGFLVGIHAGNGGFLLRTLDGRGVTLSRYGGSKLLRRVTAEEKAKYAELKQAIKKAQDTFTDFEQTLQVDGHELLKNAAAAPPEEKPKRGRKG